MVLTRGLVALALLSSLTIACAKQEMRLPDEPGTEAINPGNEGDTKPRPDVIGVDPDFTSNQEEQVLKNYEHFDPTGLINAKLLRNAKLYFHANKNRFANVNVITIIDYSLCSKKKRLSIIDTKSGAVWQTYVAHGKGSDSDHNCYAERFSNVSGSNATSLGPYKTAETYSGSHGYSLKLDGLASTNSNARPRAIVVHGADYVEDAERIQGRSLGCPAIPMKFRTQIIDRIRGGSLIYAGASAQL